MLHLRNCIQRELFSIRHLKPQILYATSTKSVSIDEPLSETRTQFIDYLINNLGFTKESAISSASMAKSYGSLRELPVSCKRTGIPSVASAYKKYRPSLLTGAQLVPRLISRGVTTLDDSLKSDPQEASAVTEVPSRIKFKRLDKTARHIMQILDKEAVQEVRSQREIPDIRPGYIIQMRLETPENKRRVSTVKGIVIARRNAGLNSTIRIRRLVAGVGVESLLPLYSPNIKEIKVLDKKKVRRAKLYYLRDKMNALRK